MAIRILVVEDHAMLRDAFRALFERHGGLSVVGEAKDGVEALSAFERLQPDVTLMDLWLPRMSGLVATRAICERSPGARVLIVSVHDERVFVEDALRAGASGYVVKAAEAVELLQAVVAVARGDMFLSPAIARHAVGFARHPATASAAGEAALSTREREVLQHIAEGRSSKEVAALLHLSVRTVETHRANLMRKLGLNKTSALVRYAIRERLIAP